MVKRDVSGLWFAVLTLLVWLFVGGRVRRAYRKALEDNRIYYLDNQPSGEPEP